MHTRALVFALIAVSGCVSDATEDGFEFGDPKPMQPGKGDGPTACGTESCEYDLCGYDCSVAGQQATRSCAATDGRASTFVTASVGGSSFDSRTNPYVPQYSTSNVIAYGCELWDYSNGASDGLQVQYEEIIHTSIVVDPNNPTRTAKDFGLYIPNFMGPGSYRGDAYYRPSSETPRTGVDDACSVDVTVDATGTVAGTFTCALGASSATGSFGCSKSSLNYPIFSAWAAAPH